VTPQQQQQYSNFINSIGAAATKKHYSFYLDKFKQFLKDEDGLFPSNPKQIEQNVINYLSSLRQKDLSHHYLKAALTALTHFYMINDFTLNRRKISRFAMLRSDQKVRRSKKNRNAGYSTEQIHQLLDFCDERTKAIVLIYCSTGMRLAALPEIKIGDLRLIDDSFQLYEITVYEGYREEYVTFCTPECTKAIKSYLEYRERSGEKLTDDSPLIREQFNPLEPLRVKHARPVSYKTIQKILRDKLVQSGERTMVHTGPRSPGLGARLRKDIPLIHGFRKFFNTALLNADVNPITKELLMGHSVRLDDFYYDKDSKKSKQKLLDEYVKAIDNLTISEENRLGLKVQQLTAKADEVTQLRLDFEAMKQRMGGPPLGTIG